jgi:hypothetical protein
MRPPRMQIELRWLMVGVAVAAIRLSLPVGVLPLLLVAAIPTILITLPAAVAPRGRRVEAACWAIAIHPLVLLA